jgi:hypothetical protein
MSDQMVCHSLRFYGRCVSRGRVLVVLLHLPGFDRFYMRRYDAEEAFEKTGPGFSLCAPLRQQKKGTAVLLNYITAPNLVIACQRWQCGSSVPSCRLPRYKVPMALFDKVIRHVDGLFGVPVRWFKELLIANSLSL